MHDLGVDVVLCGCVEMLLTTIMFRVCLSHCAVTPSWLATGPHA